MGMQHSKLPCCWCWSVGFGDRLWRDGRQKTEEAPAARDFHGASDARRARSTPLTAAAATAKAVKARQTPRASSGPRALPLDPPSGAKLRKSQFVTVADVAEFVVQNMPGDAPGSLSEEDYFAVLAFDLQANGIDLDKKLDGALAASLTIPRRLTALALRRFSAGDVDFAGTIPPRRLNSVRMNTLENSILESNPGESLGLSDEAVIARIRDGEPWCFEILMRRHNRRVFRATRAILKRDDEAEDVMQEAYVRAYEHLAEFRGEASFATWLTRIAIHEALARKRREQRFDASRLAPQQSTRLVARVAP